MSSTSDFADDGAPLGCGCTVLLSDSDRARRDLIRAVVGEVDARAEFIGPAALSLGDSLIEGHAVAFVMVGDGSGPDSSVLSQLTPLKDAGLSICAYADGLKRWSVRSKCLPLLAGASHLLDSGSAGFGTEVRQFLEHALQELVGKRREQREIRDLMRRHGMVGDSPAITSAFRLAMRFSLLSDLPVLITGETGTGKELLAKAICRMDPKRQHGPFVAVNCAAVNPTLMESEFFGHRRGSFTGAERDRKGLIRSAEGGTLFLDEVGELAVGLQAKLLRVLQENSVMSVGEEREVPVNVRFIAATNRNLEPLVASREFRADLLHRLRVLSVNLPTLRERPSDIPLLVLHFLQKRQPPGHEAAVTPSEDFLAAVQQLDFPGNVRQLESVVCHALARCHSSGTLDLNDLPEESLRQLSGSVQEAGSSDWSKGAEFEEVHPPLASDMNELVKRILDGQGWNLTNALRECERRVFHAAIDRTQGNQSQAARLLGITVRSVYNKVRRYHVSIGSARGDD